MLTIKIIHRLILATSLLLSATLLNAQAIKGRVTDASTGKPVVGASVYLNGTYLGTSTDSTGNFSLPAMQTSTPLLVSYIGYESQSISNYTGKDLIIALKHKTNTLKEVTIVVDEMSREKKMKIFLMEFIGSTNKDCVIANPDDIWLHYNKKTDELTAGADKPLLIRNKKLGYNITYFLDTFKHKIDVNKTSYAGNYLFADDTAGFSSTETAKILRARNEAYLGSRMHFVRALWLSELNVNNFSVYKPMFPNAQGSAFRLNAPYHITSKDFVRLLNDQKFHDQKYIDLQYKICIVYEKKSDKKVSVLRQKDGYPGVLIDNNGYYSDGLIWEGDIGTARVNKLLPFEFQPANP